MYYDPDVLPEGVKKFLPIQEPQGHGMSLEEYEKWRTQQAGYTPSSLEKKESDNVVVAITKDDELKSEGLLKAVMCFKGDVNGVRSSHTPVVLCICVLLAVNRGIPGQASLDR